MLCSLQSHIPVLDALINLVHDIERGRREISRNTFDVHLTQCEPGFQTISAAL
jgi:hypothetical protein